MSQVMVFSSLQLAPSYSRYFSVTKAPAGSVCGIIISVLSPSVSTLPMS